MNTDTILLIVQMVAAFGVLVSVIYLGLQIHQQNEITKAQLDIPLLNECTRDILIQLKTRSLVIF